MKFAEGSFQEALVRFIILSAAILAVGFIVFRYRIFVPTYRTFQFVDNGIIVGIAYAALRSKSPRDGFAFLVPWYFISTGLIGRSHGWFLVVAAVNMMANIAVAYGCHRAAMSPFFPDRIRRILAATLLSIAANALTVLTLALFLIRTMWHQGVRVLNNSYDNAQLGAFIGIGVGIGIEVAELAVPWIRTRIASLGEVPSDENHDRASAEIHEAGTTMTDHSGTPA